MNVLNSFCVTLIGILLVSGVGHCYDCRNINENQQSLEVQEEVSYRSYFKRCWEVSVPENYALQISIVKFKTFSQYVCGSSSSTPYWRGTTNWWDTTSYWRSTTSYWRDTTSTSSYWWRTTNRPTSSEGNLIIEEMDGDYSRGKYFHFQPDRYSSNPIILRRGANITLELDNYNGWCQNYEMNLKINFKKVSLITTIKGVNETRMKLEDWLMSQLVPPLKWKDDIQRAVIALHLSGGANFAEIDTMTELLIKQVDLKSSIELLRNNTESVSLSTLTKIVNALLVTCHNPRNFFGYDLIKMTREKLFRTPHVTNPSAFLALCNANETLSRDEYDKIEHIIQVQSKYPFQSDIRTLSTMASICYYTSRINDNITNANLQDSPIGLFEIEQHEDGSFGNVYSTAVVTQTLMALTAHKAYNRSFENEINRAVTFLVDHLNTSSIDFQTAYYVLPILAGKTLLDIKYTDCSNNPRRNRNGDDISDIENQLGKKVKVQYSLVIGEKEDITSTISLRVADNTTAFDVMRLAGAVDPKYEFDWKEIGSKIYVYKMANIPIDPEEGQYWLTYYKTNKSSTLYHVVEGPKDVYLHDGYHLIQWYRVAQL